MLRAAMVATVLALACAEQRFELIAAPATVDAGSSDGGDDADAGCDELSLDLGRRFTHVALAIGARGPIGFGVVPGGGGLETIVLRDAGVQFISLAATASESTFSAVAGPRGVGVAFHAPAPSLQLVDDDGHANGAAQSLLKVQEGANAPWGLRLSADSQRYLLAYRTLGAEAAFTSTTDAAPRYAVMGFAALLEVDGALAGDSVRLVLETGGQVQEWLGSLDGGLESQRVLRPTPLAGRPFVCQAVSLFPRREADGGTVIEAFAPGGAPFVVAEGASRLVRGVCEASSTWAMVIIGRELTVRRVELDGTSSIVTSIAVPTLDDAMVARDAQSVWVLTAPRTEPAVLYRRCLR